MYNDNYLEVVAMLALTYFRAITQSLINRSWAASALTRLRPSNGETRGREELPKAVRSACRLSGPARSICCAIHKLLDCVLGPLFVSLRRAGALGCNCQVSSGSHFRWAIFSEPVDSSRVGVSALNFGFGLRVFGSEQRKPYGAVLRP